MNLSTKKKITIWTTVILIIIFQGFDYQYSSHTDMLDKHTGTISTNSSLVWYGVILGIDSSMIMVSENGVVSKSIPVSELCKHRGVPLAIHHFGKYGHRFAIAIFLIGLALLVTIKNGHLK